MASRTSRRVSRSTKRSAASMSTRSGCGVTRVTWPTRCSEAGGSPFEECPCRHKHRLFGFADRFGREHDQWRFAVELRIGRPEKGTCYRRAVDGFDSPDCAKQHGESADDVTLAGLGLPLDPVANSAGIFQPKSGGGVAHPHRPNQVTRLFPWRRYHGLLVCRLPGVRDSRRRMHHSAVHHVPPNRNSNVTTRANLACSAAESCRPCGLSAPSSTAVRPGEASRLWPVQSRSNSSAGGGLRDSASRGIG
jgi:hypothetical protein